MKTAEEKAEELLAEIGVEDILFTTNEIQHQYISDLMVRFAKALLEEAAEKIEERNFVYAPKILLSLIPKDTTKD